jgi:membrane-bound lytic murein transglycosylase B
MTRRKQRAGRPRSQRFLARFRLANGGADGQECTRKWKEQTVWVGLWSGEQRSMQATRVLRRSVVGVCSLMCAALIAAGASPASAKQPKPSRKHAVHPPKKRAPVTRAEVIGWDYLIDKLVADGVDRARVVAVFRDPRAGEFYGLDFGIARAGESHALYRDFLRPQSIAAAQLCRTRYDQELRDAEERFAVPASVVSALIHVETHCGRNTGSSPVFARLARLAMANDPYNLRRNIARNTKGLAGTRAATVERLVRLRARELEGVFYPEVLAMFALEDRTGIDPLDLRGSGSGAFGVPQFLPSSYLRFAVDGNGDGRISLYDPADAIASAANYLAHHGWRPGLTYSQQRQVIWAYNHSDPYIDTVLTLAAEIEREQPSRRSLAER